MLHPNVQFLQTNHRITLLQHAESANKAYDCKTSWQIFIKHLPYKNFSQLTSALAEILNIIPKQLKSLNCRIWVGCYPSIHIVYSNEYDYINIDIKWGGCVQPESAPSVLTGVWGLRTTLCMCVCVCFLFGPFKNNLATYKNRDTTFEPQILLKHAVLVDHWWCH